MDLPAAAVVVAAAAAALAVVVAAALAVVVVVVAVVAAALAVAAAVVVVAAAAALVAAAAVVVAAAAAVLRMMQAFATSFGIHQWHHRKHWREPQWYPFGEDYRCIGTVVEPSPRYYCPHDRFATSSVVVVAVVGDTKWDVASDRKRETKSSASPWQFFPSIFHLEPNPGHKDAVVLLLWWSCQIPCQSH